MTAPGPPLDGRPVGYVLKMFPRLSETFVLGEILGREANGERVAIASLRPPVDGRFHASLAALRAPVTWIDHGPRRAADGWEQLAAARRDLPRLPAVLDDLLAVDAEDAFQAIAVARWADETGIAHLHAHFATTATTVTRLAGRLTGIPYSFTAHAKDIFHQSVDDADLARKVLDAHHVVTISDHNVADLRRRLPAACGARIHRVYNGLDLTVGSVGGVDGAAPAEGTPVVAIGRFVEKKGFSVLLDALAALRDRGRPTPATVIGGGRLDEALRGQARAAHLDDLVTFTGPLAEQDAMAHLRAATVLVAPMVVADDGDRDGLPTVLLEAMARGVPVISTPVTGIPEAVVHDRTGVLVPPGDPAALADAVADLLDDPARRDRLRTAARRHVAARFDRATQAAALAALRAGAPVVPAPDAPAPDAAAEVGPRSEMVR